MATSHEVGCSSECCERRRCGAAGLAAAMSTSRFHARPDGITSCVVPRLLAKTGSSSPELGLLFRVRTASCLPAARMQRAPPMGSRSQSRYQPGDPLACRAPSPALRSALGVSHTLDGLLSPRPCGLVSSRNHVRDSPFRGFLPPLGRRASSALRALLSLPTFASHLVASVLPAPVTSPSGL